MQKLIFKNKTAITNILWSFRLFSPENSYFCTIKKYKLYD